MEVLDILEKEAPVALPERYQTMEPAEMARRVIELKEWFGPRLFLPGHHYQKDEVIRFADQRGDSLKLAQISAANREAEYIVFCGVHFMAETADMLTDPHQKVILPDLRAGCSMADMADIDQTQRGWKVMQRTFGDTIMPLTYVNSTAAIKSFVGRHGGSTTTSSNSADIIRWAFTQKERILFLPDQHLGRNTAYDLGIPLDRMAVWNPQEDAFECDGPLEEVRVILWKGHCSVHEKFNIRHIENLRSKYDDINIIVHPECTWEVVQAADYSGSTNDIIQTIAQAEPGTRWAIGTEMNLVNRIIQEHPEKNIVSLNPFMCPCLTMNRIDLPHLLWSLERLREGEVVNQITVGPDIREYAVIALNRMLELS